MPENRTTKASRDVISNRFIFDICERLAENKRVRRKLPMWGRVHIDRQLPFLCIYRRPVVDSDVGTDRLVTSEASYLCASGVRQLHHSLGQLVRGLSQSMVERFGAFLIVELWARHTPDDATTDASGPQQPHFRIVAPRASDLDPVVETFHRALALVKAGGEGTTVEITRSARWGPRDLPAILSYSTAKQMGCSVLGVEVRPVYRDTSDVDVYPAVLRQLRRGLTRAMRRALYDFTVTHTKQHPPHFHALGRRAVVRAVWDIDRQMAEVADSFDFLLQVTPINARQAWNDFQSAHYEREPGFVYRPLPVDPGLLKRTLYSTPIERIEDPAIMDLFRAKQDELDRKITMLTDINTKRFVHGSLQVFGGVDKSISKLAKKVLGLLPRRSSVATSRRELSASSLAKLAQKEIEYYRTRWPECEPRVYLRNDIAVGLMVSNGCLLIDRSARFPVDRVRALLEHEIGTHVVTYWNGQAQPFRQLYSGLAGYDVLQEGLAVLAEHLAGGLTMSRLRILAGRVLAISELLRGATFVDIYRRLHRDFDLSARGAFNIATRTCRGGGLTKDVIYLKGLDEVLRYLANGGTLEELFVGKIAIKHASTMRELRFRGVLHPTPCFPRVLTDQRAVDELRILREGSTVVDLVERIRRCA